MSLFDSRDARRASRGDGSFGGNDRGFRNTGQGIGPLTSGTEQGIFVIFNLPLADAGAGAVNLVPVSSAGSATSTFTRASTAWTKLSTGLWASVASGTARSCYTGSSTAVGTYAGYFAEGAGTQLVTPTASIRDMTDASWVKVTMTSAKTSTGIDGVGNSCTRLTASAGNATILQTLVAAATTRTYSCFIKRITGVGEIDISEDGVSWTNITGQINSSTFTRVSVTVSQLNAAFGLRIVTNGDAIDIDFNQFEAGTYPTSPMDTAGAVRAGDVLTYSAPGNISDQVGSFTCQYSSINPGLDANYLGMTGTVVARAFTTETLMQDSSGFRHPGIVPIMTGAITKFGARWSVGANSANVAQSGVGGSATPWIGGWTLTTLGVNCAANNSQQLNGMIQNVVIYNGALTDAALAVLTT